ncbi:putative cytochrome P450 120 [Tubulanus polymorphus]|uniref:putative cytochrome P450 120 n=1 Tax=Tubulanus polymorphus TaxID=672921 RepID=UPI003DA46835
MMMMAALDDGFNGIPGNAGFPVIGDKSYEYYADPVDFVETKINEHQSRVFVSRILNKPTVFVGSNTVARELLSDQTDNLELGYKSLMGEIFGQNILFTEGPEAHNLRLLMSNLFSHGKMSNFHSKIESIIQKSLGQLTNTAQIKVYEFFKRMMTEICLSVFLDLDFEESTELASTIVNLTTTHWHGIISVPLNVKLLGMGKSTFAKAVQARDKLIHIIEEKVQNSAKGFLKLILPSSFPTESSIVNHLLLLTSALVPKAFASILTSFVIGSTLDLDEIESTMKNMQSSSDYLESILLETIRLWPPFAAGRRLIRKDFEVLGYKFSKGWAVMYTTYSIHRDPCIFSQPEKFIPERWMTCNKDDRDKLVAFGSGARGCVGKNFSWGIIKMTAALLVSKYTWKLPEGQDLKYKWLPVSRPKNDVIAIFQVVEDQNANTAPDGDDQ